MKELYRLLLAFALMMCASFPAQASLNLILPTPNTNLYEHPEKFYMKTARSGADAWKGGMYGFSRNAKRLSAGTVHTRFHEGVDIAPTMRDERGNPLDSVVSVDEGLVVYVNAIAGRSNYGKYIVVRHLWDGSPFYSLYAHLNETWVEAGQQVNQGDPLGRLGFTGAGINRSRAHLHFEIGMLVNEYFQKWYNQEYGDGKNHHSFYNGMNFAGMDVARLYQRLKEEQNLTVREFLRTEHTPFYTVILPRDGRLDLLSRYPWLLKESAVPSHPSWEITFDQSGLPLAIVPSEKNVTKPTLASIEESPFPYKYITKYRVQGSGAKGSLSASGERFMRLIATEPDSSTLAKGMIADQEAVETYWQQGSTGPSATAPTYTDEIPAEGMEDEDTDVADASIEEENELIPEEPNEVAEEEEAVETVDAIEPKQKVVRDVEEVSDEVTDETGGMGDEETAKDSEDVYEDPPEDRPLENRRVEGRPSGNNLPRSPLHTKGYFFSWVLNGEQLEIEMQPVVLATASGNKVTSVMARCDDCARFGMSQPQLKQLDPTTWSLQMAVVDKARLADRIQDINGKVFLLELYIKTNGEESVSSIQVRTTVPRNNE